MTESYFRVLVLTILLPYGLFAYPVYGTKRYGRASIPHQNAWMHLPSFYYQTALPRPHTYHAPSYYELLNPYAPEYDDYYYQDPVTYPLYYPPFTQPIIPYSYYYSPSYYDTSDQLDDIPEEMLQQEQEREQREEALPIGQETWFENDQHDDSLDDVNAAFMKNLMLYNNAMSTPNLDPYNYDEESWNSEEMDPEDEDVQELKNIKKIGNTKEERMQMFQKVNRNPKITRYQPNDSDSWMKYGNKRAMGSTVSPLSVNTPDSLNTVTPGRDARGGQKEVVMMRPATPVRRPFSEPVMKLLAKQGGPERKRTPSVYDTIKHMLEMEKSLEKENQPLNYYHVPMKKRYVSSEESLVEELAGLKKTA